MAYNNAVSNSDDVIDSRDIISRIEELESERADLRMSIEEKKDAISEVFGDDRESAEQEYADALSDLETWEEENREELKTLKALTSEAEGYGDWAYGETLIREDYFTEYAEQLAEDLGYSQDMAKWPFTHIDWEAAARELKYDYTEVDFDGVTYLMRA